MVLFLQILLLQMCQHSRKAKLFCISEECRHSSCYGCSQCIRKYHKGSLECVLQQQEVLQMMKVYHVPPQVKEERKGTIYKVYQVLNNIKNQIYDHIDTHFNSILSKIKYPFLHHANILQPYRLVRDKNYHKMDHSKLINFYQTSKATTNQEFISKEIQYYQQYLKETHSSIQNLTSQISTIEKIFNFSITKESHALHQELMAELSANNSKGVKLEVRQLKGSSEVTKSWTSLKESDPQQKETHAVVVQRDARDVLNSSLRLELPIKKGQAFLTPKKQERELDLSFDKTTSILMQEESEVKTTHLSQRENVLFPEENAHPNRLSNKSAVEQRHTRKDQSHEISKDDKQKSKGQHLREYTNNLSNTDSIFIKVSEVIHKNQAQNSYSKLTKSTISQEKEGATVIEKSRQKEAVTKQKEQSVKKRLSDLIKSKDQEKKTQQVVLNSNKSTSQLSQMPVIKNKLQPKPSYFLNATAKRKGSRHDSQLNDSLGKDVFEFARQQKPKIISRSIKKEIPHVELGNSVKTEPVPKNTSFLKQGQESSKQKQMEMAAIFISGIQQPLSENKIYFLEKYIQRYETNLTAVQLLTFLYLQKGKFKECLNLSTKYLDKLVDNDSKLTLVVNKSGALNNLGRYSQAIKMLQEYLKHGQNDKLHKNIADAYYNISVLDKAIYHYERAIKYNSQFDQAYFNVAVILYRQESFFNAKMNIEKALRINKTEEHYLQLHSHIQEKISMNDTKV